MTSKSYLIKSKPCDEEIKQSDVEMIDTSSHQKPEEIEVADTYKHEKESLH
jgi:hypothetical protein